MKKIISTFLVAFFFSTPLLQALSFTPVKPIKPYTSNSVPNSVSPPADKPSNTVALEKPVTTGVNLSSLQFTSQFIPTQYIPELAKVYLTDIDRDTVKVNFQDITQKNAGVVVKSWTDSSTFPKKFVLESGMSIKLDPAEVSKKLVKINTVKGKINTYKNLGIKVGEVKSELRMLPDRLQLFETVELSYKTATQLDNIKKDIYKNGEFETELQNINKKNLKAINQRGLSDSALKKSGLAELQKLPATQAEIDAQATQGLIAYCKEQFSASDSRCIEKNVLAEVALADKTIVVEEKLEFSLIPPTSAEGGFDLVAQKAGEVRISKSQISAIFKNYKIASYTKYDIPKSVPYPEAPDNKVKAGNYLIQEAYCNKQYPLESEGGPKGGNGQANSKRAECLDIMKEKMTSTSEEYTKNLLNGFTLGESQSYEWKTKQRIDLWVKTITLYELGARFYYSYGFGMRIPIQAKVSIADTTLDDHPKSSQAYKLRIGIKTLDGNEGYYASTGLPGNKIFAGKEFVLEVSAGIELSAYVIGIGGFHVDIGFMSLLAQYFGDILVNDLGIPKSEIDAIIASNKFDKGKNFIPPFAGQNNIPLLNVSPTFPIYSLGIFTLLARLILETSLGGQVRLHCENYNSSGGCGGQTVEFKESNVQTWREALGNPPVLVKNPENDTYKWRTFSPTALYPNGPKQQDELGKYNNFGAVLDKFQYIPTLIVKLFVQGGVRIGLPYIGSIELWTPKIKIFAMEFSSDAFILDTHEGTDGVMKAYDRTKIYGAKFLELIKELEVDLAKGAKISTVPVNPKTKAIPPRKNVKTVTSPSKSLSGTTVPTKVVSGEIGVSKAPQKISVPLYK